MPAGAMTDPLRDRLGAEIARRGSVPFSTVMEVALYDPTHGFYAGAGGRAGRRADFLTSPEVGPLFGAVVARALDRWWDDAGRPDPWVVVDAGAGPGTLARAVLAAGPACAAALRYVLVERSATQRAAHGERLALEDPTLAFAAPTVPDDEDVPAVPPPPGPIVVSLAELPRLPGPCVVLANELLDNLPVDLAERTDDGWDEVRIGTAGATASGTDGTASGADGTASGTDGTASGADGSRDGDLVEQLVALDPDRAALLERLAPTAVPGARVPLQAAACAWLRDALDLAGPGGRVVAIDYAGTTAELAARPQSDWLRTYRGHARGGPPLEALGTQDITCEVAIDQLALAGEPDHHRAQADWLAAHGLGELVEEGKRIWHERAAVGDLAAVRARSRVGEAEALTDPASLGAFHVLEWER